MGGGDLGLLILPRDVPLPRPRRHCSEELRALAQATNQSPRAMVGKWGGGGLRPPKGAAPIPLLGHPENVARALGVCQGHESLSY